VYATEASCAPCGTAQRSWSTGASSTPACSDRLAKLGFVTTIVTTGPEREGDEKPRDHKAVTGPDVASSGRGDLNPGPPAPEAGALTGLRYAPCVGERGM
jgi:hypothetical protein